MSVVKQRDIFHDKSLAMFIFFIKEENGKVFVTVKSLKYKVSTIPSGGLEVPLSLTFLRKEKWVVDTMEKFIQNIYTFEYSGNKSVDTSNSEDEEEDDYQTIVLEPENEEDEYREKSQPDKIDLNRQRHTCSYYNTLINSIFIVLF